MQSLVGGCMQALKPGRLGKNHSPPLTSHVDKYLTLCSPPFVLLPVSLMCIYIYTVLFIYLFMAVLQRLRDSSSSSAIWRPCLAVWYPLWRDLSRWILAWNVSTWKEMVGLWIGWFVFENGSHKHVVYCLRNGQTLGKDYPSRLQDVKPSEYRKQNPWLI